MSGDLFIVLVIAGVCAMFAFIHLIDRKSKSRERTGKPSRLIRVTAIVIGLLGLGFVHLTGWDWKAAILILPWVIILLGYGIFGLFGKAQDRTVKIAMGYAMTFIILMWLVTRIFFPLSSVEWPLVLAIPPIFILLEYGFSGLFRKDNSGPSDEARE